MKLIDILARELKEWPQGLECLSQLKGSGYIINGKGFDGRAFDVLQIAEETKIAGAIVTLAEWQAARDALVAAETKEWDVVFQHHGKIVLSVRSDGVMDNYDRDGLIAHIKSLTDENTAREWNGEGLPPVGTACEMQDANGSWRRVNIFADHEGYVHGWDAERSINYFSNTWSEFRPIRTAEQIAADEREKAAQEMHKRFGGTGGLTLKQCIWVISEGYRKQEQSK